MIIFGNEEYEQIKKFLILFVERTSDVSKAPPESRPLAQIQALEAKYEKKVVAGVMGAMNDCLTLSFGLPAEKVRGLDKELRELGLPTLSQLRVKYSKRYSTLLEKGVIRNESDYQLIKGVLDDSELLNEAMREKALQMLSRFEEKPKGTLRRDR